MRVLAAVDHPNIVRYPDCYVVRLFCISVSSRIRFLRQAKNEVRVLAAMDHPNIVQYLDCFVAANEGLSIVMELCDGGDLDGMIRHAICGKDCS